MLFAIFNTEMEMNEWTLMSLKEKDIETASSSSFHKYIYSGPQKGSPSCNNTAPKGVVGRGSPDRAPSLSLSFSLAWEHLHYIEVI